MASKRKRKRGTDTWAEDYCKEARDFFRSELVKLLNLHLRMVGDDGHLTQQDMAEDLIAAAAMVTTNRAVDLARKTPTKAKPVPPEHG
jgi:hypothetical protein